MAGNPKLNPKRINLHLIYGQESESTIRNLEGNGRIADCYLFNGFVFILSAGYYVVS